MADALLGPALLGPGRSEAATARGDSRVTRPELPAPRSRRDGPVDRPGSEARASGVDAGGCGKGPEAVAGVAGRGLCWVRRAVMGEGEYSMRATGMAEGSSC
jgi:hypothetical protein